MRFRRKENKFVYVFSLFVVVKCVCVPFLSFLGPISQVPWLFFEKGVPF